MALLAKEGILSLKWMPRLELVRFRRVNVQRPRPPHYERAKYLALMEPMYKEEESVYLPPSVKCKKNEELMFHKMRMENPLERILAQELYDKFQSMKMICFVHTNPITGDEAFQARILLKREKMHIHRYSKSLVKTAFQNTHFEAILPLFNSYSSVIFSEEANVDKLFQVLKKVPQYILMAGILDNRFLNVSQLKKYSEIKDLTTARAQLVGVLNSCAQQTVNQLMAHPQRLLAQLELLAKSESQ